MNFFNNVTHFDFVGSRRTAFKVSGSLLLVAMLSLLLHGGLNWGIDFAGGTFMQIKFEKPIKVGELRKALGSLGIGDSVIQKMGEESSNQVLIKVEKLKEEKQKGIVTLVTNKIKEVSAGNNFEILRAESVGPKVGHDMAERGFLAFISSIIGILIYVTIRFEFNFAVGAIIALVHDVCITVGFISLTNKEFTLSVLAALLTIAGYSVNDTLVVFDRIRENLRKHVKGDFDGTINTSINETLSRTMLTSLTTVIVTIVLSMFGGPVIRDFATCLTVGVIVGTFSSVFVATPVVVEWRIFKKNRDEVARKKALLNPKPKVQAKEEKVEKEATKAEKETPQKVEKERKETVKVAKAKTPSKKKKKKKKKKK